MSFLYRIKSRINSNKYLICFFVVLLFINLINTVHNSFPDEFDNILGGYYINKGLLPYRDFFSHHGLVSYFIASLITIITKQSFVFFRLIYSAVILFYFICLYKFIIKRLGKEISLLYLIFIFILGLSSTYFWGHMLLADNISAYLILPVYILLLIKIIGKLKLSFFDMLIIAFFTALAFFTSITYSYIILFINLLVLFIFYVQHKNMFLSLNTIKLFSILSAPYILFFTYFAVSGSLAQFYQQNIAYNKNIYIYNYPRPEGSTRFNPVRYAIVIGYNFFNNSRSLLVQVKDFNFSYPFNITLALVNSILLLYLLVTKRFLAAVYVLTILVFSNARSNPLNSKETDFQSAVYITLSLFNLPFIFYTLVKELKKNQEYIHKLIYSFMILLLSSYSFFFSLFIFNKFLDKAFGKFMGMDPMIYDRPVIAPIINKLTNNNDYVWIGPHEFEELLYLNEKQPSKYHWFLRAHSQTENIKREFMENMQRNEPKIVVYKRDFSAYGSEGQSMNSLLINFLAEKYFQISEKPSVSMPYKTNFKEGNFSMATDFYFIKDQQQELINKLLQLNLIQYGIPER